MKIQPIHYRYKPDNAMGIRDTSEHIGIWNSDHRPKSASSSEGRPGRRQERK